MTTVTLRVPESMAAHLTSAQMRSWLVDFLRRTPCLPILAQANGGCRSPYLGKRSFRWQVSSTARPASP